MKLKRGSGPILLTCSFSYVRDWLNEHPFRNEPDARLICNLYNGAPLNPKTLWNIIEQLKKRISTGNRYAVEQNTSIRREQDDCKKN
jgi:hypothetical protein